jgi:hypothetical protein
MLDTSATGIIDLRFHNGNSAKALSLSSHNTSQQALNLMGLTAPQPALVIIGGASLMTTESLEQLQTIFNQVFAPLAQDLGLTVLDGGTDAGVIQMMGRARQQVKGNFPLIGVAPEIKTRLPGDQSLPPDDESRYALEPHHTHFFLVPGKKFGSESPWLAEFAAHIATGRPSLTILINGGDIAFTDLQENLALGRPTVVLSGSGRLADSIAAAIGGDSTAATPEVLALIHHYQPSGKLTLLEMSTPADEMRDRLQQYFTPTT